MATYQKEQGQYMTPDALFVGMHHLFDDDYIASLSKGDRVDLASSAYLDAIQPKWSTYDFVADEDMKDYFIENSNIGVFLDNFIAKMLGV